MGGQDTARNRSAVGAYATETAFLDQLDSQSPPTTSGRQRRDVLRRAQLMAVFLLVSMLATNAWLIYQSRESQIGQANLSNTNLVRAVAERVQATVAEVDHVLGSLVEELERAEMHPDAIDRMQPMLVSHVASIDQLKGLFVYNESGRWIASSEPTWEKSLNNSDRSYFRYHRDNSSSRVLVSPPIISRSSNEWILPVSRRLVDADGKFAGVALATVKVQHLRSLLDRFNVGSGGAITLAVSGHILLRKPYVEADLGKPAPVSAFSKLAGTTRSGTVAGQSPIDGVMRLASFEMTKDYPIRVSVATSKSEVLREWSIISWVQTVWVIFLCIVLLVASEYVRRSVSDRLKTEQDLRNARDDLKHANGRLAHMAQYDRLTGLPNRRFFDRRLTRYCQQAQR